MNFKIENRILNIMNYPSIERHFGEMAEKGWLIHKIILENIFIYKKIQPEELDFSISPYEIETTFTKKTKTDLKEFRSVCESVGWNYATNSFDLHIYFKEKESEAIDLETDEEEKYNTLKKIGKKEIMGNYLVLFIFAPHIFYVLNGFIPYIDIIQSSLLQLTSIFIFLLMIFSINRIKNLKKFFNKNKENIKLGKPLEYRDSKFNFEKILILFTSLTFIVFLADRLYGGLILKDYSVFIAFLPLLIGIVGGTAYRIFVKPLRKRKSFKIIIFIVVLLMIVILDSSFTSKINLLLRDYDYLNMDDYRVMLNDKSQGKDQEENLSEDWSIFVPKSYGYGYFDFDKKTYIYTNYSEALNEDIAEKLVSLYIKQAKKQVEQYKFNIEMAIEDNNYYIVEEMYSDIVDDFPKEKTLQEIGLSLEEFQQIEKNIIRKAVKESLIIIKDRAITRDEENLWKLDHVYFLNYDKT